MVSLLVSVCRRADSFRIRKPSASCDSLRQLVLWPYWIPLFLVLGVLVRVRHYAQNHSYWYDEAYLLSSLFGRSFADLIGPIDHIQVAPPAFLWVERATYLLFGPAEWAMRLPAFVAGLVALGLMVPLARRVVGGWAAWLPVALLAFGRHSLTHGCEVKPYSTDLLTAVAVLLAAAGVVAGGSSRRSRAIAAAALVALAAAGPWMSFPAVFALGGAVVATLVWAARSGCRGAWVVGLMVGATAAGSAATVWYFDARHLYYPGVDQNWHAGRLGGFPDWSSLRALVWWPVKCGIEVGNYGTREMGAVLVLLAGFGVRRFFRVNPALAAALLGTPLLALAATYLGKYPLVDRTVMFLLPGLWLAAAAGVAELAQRFPSHRWPFVLPFAVLLFDVITFGQHLITPPAFPAAREAYEHVHCQQLEGDVLWISHAEVYQVYHGTDGKVCGCTTAPDEVVRRAAGGRVWLVDQPAPGFSMAAPVVAALQAQGYCEVERQVRPGILVMLFSRPPVR